MSHDIADCPECGRRDFVLKENGEWECLKCKHTHRMLKTESGDTSSSGYASESKIDAMTLLIAALIAGTFIIFAFFPHYRYPVTPYSNTVTFPAR